MPKLDLSGSRLNAVSLWTKAQLPTMVAFIMLALARVQTVFTTGILVRGAVLPILLI